jgi:hypothetical protein
MFLSVNHAPILDIAGIYCWNLLQSKPMNTPEESKSLLPWAVVLIVLAAGYRVVRAAYWPDLPNFSPLMAMAFCGGLFLPLRWAVGVVFGALLLSDLWIQVSLNSAPGTWLLWSYPLYGFAIALGAFLRKRPFRLRYFYGGVLLNAIIFYLVTNTGSWMANPAYAKTIAGWIQALTVGVPGYPPTWTFFRNTLFSDMLFSSLMAGSWFVASGKLPLPSKPKKKKPAKAKAKRAPARASSN